MILDLVEVVTPLAEGMSVSVPVGSPEEVRLAERWCEATGNTMAAAGEGFVEVRRGRDGDPLGELPPDRRPGVRLWIYTNFDCNLACDYCCVRSSPRARRRALGVARIRRIVEEAEDAGVAELYLTGGEPFLLPDIAEIVRTCVGALPTTVLTNGTLFRGARLATLRSLPRDGLALQISIDSPDPARHDRHRGAGAWKRAVAGLTTAQGEGFRVRVAATLVTHDVTDETAMRALLDGIGIPAEDQVIRPVVRRGVAGAGLEVSADSVLPEVTVTTEGVYWHPVGADDDDLLVAAGEVTLSEATASLRDSLGERRRRAGALAQVFPCA